MKTLLRNTPLLLILLIPSCGTSNSGAGDPGDYPPVTVIKPGFVIGPSGKAVDVRDMPVGTLVEDPINKQRFRVPKDASTYKEDHLAGFKSNAGGVLELFGALGAGAVGAVAENPQLFAAAAGASSSNSGNNAAAMQQLAAASTQASGSTNSGYNSSASIQTSNSYDPNEGRKMSGVTQLGAAWMGVVNVVCHVKGENPGRNETTTQVSAAPSFVKKRNLSISIYYTVSGYDRDGKLSTKQFRDDVLVSGPYQHYAAISHGFQGGLRTVQITHVHCGGKALSAP